MNGYIRSIVPIFTTVLLLSLLTGCSNSPGQNPSDPPLTAGRIATAPVERVLWGYYEIYIDPVACEVDITPLRQTAMHLNALQYLESGAASNVTVEGPIKFGYGELNLKIGIKHPFPPKIYTGFDVRGILISRGNYDLGAGIIVPGPGNFRLLNPDGYTRFWNPAEFAGAGYQDGKLGVPHFIGGFNATVNGFKYFADGLGPDDDFSTFTSTLRGAFTSGNKNIRRYKIQIGNSGLLFNYAVDASWAMPDKTPPVVPDDFDPEKANSKEAWKVVPHIAPLFAADGSGECTIEVDVYDWQGMASIDGVSIVAPNLFTGSKACTGPVDNGDYYTYSINFTNELSYIGQNIPILITVTDTGAAANQYLKAYQLAFVSIGEVVITLAEDAHYKYPGTDYLFMWGSFDLGSVAPPVDYQDHNGPWDFASATYSGSDHRTSFGKGAPEVSGFVYDFPEDVEYFFREGANSGSLFRAESHNYGEGALFLYGMYSEELFEGSLVLGEPAKMPYPQDKNTNITITKNITIVPYLLILNLKFKLVAQGQGWAQVPLDGGTWHNCLQMRNTVEMSTSGIIGEGWIATLLAFEWIADDGTVIGAVVTSNQKDETPNFDEGTFEITGDAQFMTLEDITNF